MLYKRIDEYEELIYYPHKSELCIKPPISIPKWLQLLNFLWMFMGSITGIFASTCERHT
jgi:hypothetical protein